MEDAAEGIVLATERYDDEAPVNLGSGKEIAIKALANLVADTVGFDGQIIWDTTKPNGQPRRCLDVYCAWQRFGFRATCDLAKGIRATVEWFRAHREAFSHSDSRVGEREGVAGRASAPVRAI